GLPCVTLPLLVGETGLPMGVQLIGPAEKDDRLLRTARWLQTHLAEAAE
ncbi:MAG: amidase, partial [Tateyamaria sp.]